MGNLLMIQLIGTVKLSWRMVVIGVRIVVRLGPEGNCGATVRTDGKTAGNQYEHLVLLSAIYI